MKKRLLSVLLCLCMVLMLFPAEALARSDTDIPYAVTGGNIYFDEATGTITGCDESVTEAEIPSAINGVAVTSIGDQAFFWCGSLTSVTIPDSVTSIGDRVFNGCDSLTNITIPDSVTGIGTYAFSGCRNLADITVGSDNQAYTALDGILFSKDKSSIIFCPEGKSGAVTIPDGVTSIGDSAFAQCNSLTDITIPDGVTSIGDWAFSECGLTSVTIPGSVTGIGEWAFVNCNSLTSVTILDGVTSIRNSAFAQCYGLTSITIPDSVTSIGDGVFGYCNSLTSITIPDSVTSIGDGVFGYCNSLTDISVDSENPNYTSEDGVLFDKLKNTLICCPGGKSASYAIPDGVTSIGAAAFDDCISLTSITIPDGVTSIGDWAFCNCSGLTSITIPDGVTSIGDWAFYNCSGLTSITIPNSVTSIGDWAFSDCSSLTVISVDPENPSYASEDGVLFDKQKSILIRYPGGKSNSSYAIPDSVTSIEDYAFAGCSGLTDITIPDGVTSIGDDAFAYCDSMTSVTISDSVTSIGDGAFEQCFSLTDVYYAGSKSQWEEIMIEWRNHSLTSATIHYGRTDPVAPARTYTVTVNGGTGGGDYEVGEDVIIIAIVPEGQQFTGWIVEEGAVILDDPYSEVTSFTMPECDVTVTAIYEDEDIEAYYVKVYGGTGGGFYEVGETVTIKAVPQKNGAVIIARPEGLRFTGWIVEEGDVTLADPDSEVTTFIMPARDVTVTATYEDIAYYVKVNGGTGSGWYETGETVTIRSADILRPAPIFGGYEMRFGGWIVEEGDVTLADPDSVETTFIMPAMDVTVTVRAIVVLLPSTYTITFDPNGGTGTMDDEQVNAGGTFIFPVCGFTAPAGKEFKAWSVGGQEYAPGDTCTVTGDMTVTAVWKAMVPDGYTLTGTITGHKGVTYTSVTARLAGLNGSVYSAEVGEGVTDKTGKTDYSYSVTALAGQYNLEVEARTDAGGVVNRTALVKLTGSGQTKDVNLPNGQAKTTVNNTSGTAALVGGLDELIIDADGEVRGEVTMTIDDVDKSSPDAAAIQSAASGQTLEFMDISIIRSENEVETAVTDTGDVTIQIVLTFDSTGKSNIAVYRYHDGSVDTLTTQASGNGEKIAVDDDSLTIYAKKFSVYAIGYTVSGSDPAIPPYPAIPSDSDISSQPDSSSGYYSISIPTDITGGTVSASRKSAAKGSTVTLTVTADEGYELVSLTAADSKGNSLELTDKGDGKYTFTMPGSAVTVSAVFRMMEQQPAAPAMPDWVNPFADVPMSAWYYDAVKFVNVNSLMNGLDNNQFAPDANLSRAQLAQILYNKEGKPAVSGGSAFTDVGAGAWYADAVTWAAANHIVGGYGSGLFGPNDNITREQLAVMLWRYAGEPISIREISFSDADQISGFAQTAVRWAVENGILNGKGNNILDPKGFATRAEVAQMLKNYFG